MQMKINRVVAALAGSAILAFFGSITLPQQADSKTKTKSGTTSKARAQIVSVTGQYDYKRGRDSGCLYVKEQAPGKFQFALSSTWVGNAATGNVHSGQAGGVIQLINNKASYKKNEYTLNFNFTPGHCAVACVGDGFGGMNVDPAGNYKKVNSKVPSATDLEVFD